MVSDWWADTKDTIPADTIDVFCSSATLHIFTANIPTFYARVVCLAAHGDRPAWRWHVRFGHLNFCDLRRLATGEKVKRLPWIDHIDQVCDSCLVGKQ
jgi:hypothetical protein